MPAVRFPGSFLWGVATAAYQIEGAVQEDGRGESIWDRFSHTPGKILNGDTGDVACDHYHRYREDVALMADLNVRTYRFSIAWPRIFPTGAGAPNPKGVDFYKRLLDELERQNIIPAITLYHWDLPQALEDQGGWRNRETAARFAEYAAYMFRELGDRVPLWITHNEPWVAAFLGHAFGVHAPGLTDWSAALLAGHHILLSHGLAVQVYRAAGLRGRIGITLNLGPQMAASDRPEDQVAAQRADGYHNRWFLDPLFHGNYPQDMVELYGPLFRPEWVRGDDMAVIAEPVDFLGVNYYTRGVVQHSDEGVLRIRSVQVDAPRTEMGWEVYPQGLTDLLLRLHADYGGPVMYITENGAAYRDEPAPDGRVHDPERIDYLRRHFLAAHQALSQGVDLRGYYVWSLMDNFEWAFGYSKRFGIVYIDYATQRRIPKDSAFWFRGVAATGEVDDSEA